MADQKLTALTLISEAQLSADDMLYGVHDPAGTPASLKINIGSLTDSWYEIVPSVTGNNLTVGVTHLNGSDPTAANPLGFKIGDNREIVTGSIAFTLNAGTNWFNAGSSELASKDIDYFVFLIQESGAAAGTKIGMSRIPYPTVMGEFVNTSTNEKYIGGNWTNFNSTDPVVNIGRIRVMLSASASFNWSMPSTKIVNFPMMETGWMIWEPTFTGSGSMTFGTITVNLARYKLIRNTVNAALKATGTTGGVASTEIRATVPFDSGQIAAAISPGAGYVTDSGNKGAFVFFTAGTPDILSFSKYDASNYGLGASRVINATMVYEI